MLTKMQLAVAVLIAAAVVASVFWQGRNNLTSAQEKIGAGKMRYVEKIHMPEPDIK